jgi:regulator of RNase E activity RraA
MPEGCIAVVDAMGVIDAGIFGDILCARMKKRGVAALVTDGVMRDLAGVPRPFPCCVDHSSFTPMSSLSRRHPAFAP